MGHHHHSHHHHGPSQPLGGGGLGGRGPGGQLTASWPLAAGLAAVLFAYGAFDAFATYRIYFHGTHTMGVVTTLDARTSSTLIEVEGQVCAISGHYGRVGGMLPVAYPPGRPGNCIVRQMQSFRWPVGAMFAGGAILAGIWFWRRAAPASSA